MWWICVEEMLSVRKGLESCGKWKEKWRYLFGRSAVAVLIKWR
jgi:hypothetical protein